MAEKKPATKKRRRTKAAATAPDPVQILMEVSLEFGRNCPRPLDEDAKVTFRDLFDKSIGAGIASGRITYWNSRSRRYVFPHVRAIAREVYGSSRSNSEITSRALFAKADPYLRSAQRRAAVALRRAQNRAQKKKAAKALKTASSWQAYKTSFCDAYS